MASALVAIALAIGAPLPLAAAGLAAGCDCYALTAWTVKEGLPSGNVLSIAQDREGYLWLGTNSGLVRFDGFQFVPWGIGADAALPGTFIPALVGARDGSVWVGFEDVAGVSRILDGEVTNFLAQDGLPQGGVAALLEDRQGTLWAGGRGGLSVFRGKQWQRLGRAAGLPDFDVFSLYEDAHGGLWMGTSAGVFHRSGNDVFELSDRQLRFVQSFAEDESGVLWVTDAETFVRALSPEGRPQIHPAIHVPGAGSRLLRDQHGTVWIAALDAGLLHLTHPHAQGRPLLVRYHYEHRFSGAARSVFEDREKNIWVGMRGGGLVRLSESPVKTDIALEGLTNDGVHALSAAADGSIWVATGHALNVFARGGRKTYNVDQVSHLHADRSGDMWAATPTAIVRVKDGRFSRVRIPPAVRLGRILSLATDTRKRLWLCSYDQGLFRWGDGVLTQFEDVADVAARSCNSVYSDSRDRVWVGFTAGGLAVYERDTFRVYGPHDGLAPGAIAAIYEDHNGSIWVSTVTGLTRISKGKLTTVIGRGLPPKLVPSLVEDEDGYFWLGVNSGAAIIRLDPHEIDAAVRDRNHRISYRQYDDSDGLQGPLRRLSRPTAARGSDGRLWFVSGPGVAVIDPHEQAANRKSASPHIERVTVDGKEVGHAQQLQLPPRTLTLQIDYGALSLSSASKLRFRYRLEGLTPEWVEAEGRRQVSYTNLQPGRYRFQLQAASDASWTEHAASWDFLVLPPFYRTYWFYGLSAAVAALVFWSCWWFRLRSVRNEFALVIAERTRVSRDIHDTLLQSLGAFTLQLEVVARQLDPSQRSARDQLQDLRKQVRQCIHEARRSVWELRSPRLEAHDLVEAFRQMANDAMIAGPATIRVTAGGRPRRCAPHVEEQLLKIGQEAICNAVRHGAAAEIELTLEYSRTFVSLSIADNGCGFVVDNRAQAPSGHWGLENMRERATEVGGQFSITSGRGGTVIRAVVPL